MLSSSSFTAILKLLEPELCSPCSHSFYSMGRRAGQGAQPAPHPSDSFPSLDVPVLAARALPPSHGTCAPGEGRWPGRGAAQGWGAAAVGCGFCRCFSGTVLGACQDGCQTAPGHS